MSEPIFIVLGIYAVFTERLASFEIGSRWQQHLSDFAESLLKCVEAVDLPHIDALKPTGSLA